MPIGKEEWNLGSKYDTFEKQLLSFLRKNQDAAYTLPEIVNALGYKIEIRDLGSFVGGVAGFWLLKKTGIRSPNGMLRGSQTSEGFF